ncbi:SpvB/TcaC N-terminal domain-containing protein [Ideonella sp. DXS29W]|uniref:SpvB/TcaC N-terminal domain-containing protein n=1 Tax=Ideonella lacteola TaxID=2984193 RepID=A0ABU9BLK3_9BURK
MNQSGTHQTGPSAISLPKGGGAVKGIGETFSANLFSGTANYSVPLALSPGRHGFGPKLALQYSSGHGNGLFGLGWSLDVARISRKTEKGLPHYDDDQDRFVLSGAEDLVRTAHPETDNDSGQVRWVRDAPVERDGFSITFFRPRTEGMFARIECWVRNGSGETHWRTITKDNITHLFGVSAQARLSDPADARHVAEWLLQESFDAFGNHCLYEYAADDPVLYDADAPQRLNDIYEQRRSATQRYLRRIYYGNLPEHLLDERGQPITYADGTTVGVLRGGQRYAFEAVFDYGDWASPTSQPHPEAPPEGTQELFGPNLALVTTHREVPLRPDRFSSFRTGFDVRTLRTCSRVLMFHHFAELGGPTLVRSTDFAYGTDPDTQMSMLQAVTVTSYERAGDGNYRQASMPPVAFGYSAFRPHEQRYQTLKAHGGQMPTLTLSDRSMAVVDLLGDGLPDIVQSGPAGFQVWRNLGNGTFDRPVALDHGPAGVALGQPGVGFGDMSGNGVVDLLVNSGDLPGFYETTTDGGWRRFKPFAAKPGFDPADHNVRLLDLTGDGRADALLTTDDQFLWFACLGEEGFAAPRAVPRLHDLDVFPDVFFDDPQGRVRLADMTGDGLSDIVLVHNGGIDYWPNLGYGRFGRRVRMSNAPRLDDEFDPRRLFLADLNGTGCADAVYVGLGQVHFWFNRSGNGFSERRTLTGTPRTADPSGLQFADVFGTGTATLLWSQSFGGSTDGVYKALDFCGGVKPYVLTTMDNHMGAVTRVSYGSSTQHYLRDRTDMQPWITTLPFPTQVVDKVETFDLVGRTKHVVAYRYHHGHYDGREREFRGFARVDQLDTDFFDDFAQGDGDLGLGDFLNADPAHHLPPVETRTWYHTGVYVDARAGKLLDQRSFEQKLRTEFYAQDTEALPLPDHLLPAGGTPWQAARALRGAVLRTEVYALDGSTRAAHPYQASESRYQVSELQPAIDAVPTTPDSAQPGVYFSHTLESLSYHYERRPADPRIAHELTLGVDAFGQRLRSLAIGYGRRRPDPTLPTDEDRARQTQALLTYTETRYTNAIDDIARWPDSYRAPAPSESLVHELTGFVPTGGAGSRFTWEEWAADHFARIDGAEPLRYEQAGDGHAPQRRLLKHTRTLYRSDDLSSLLTPGELQPLALPGQTLQLALTDSLIDSVYGDRVGPELLVANAYARGDDGRSWWLPSAQVFYSPDEADTPADELAFARSHFFTALRSRDPFGNSAASRQDPYALTVLETRDALGNTALAEFDYRVLQSTQLTDANGNRSRVVFDTLGLVAASAVMGKATETVGDSLDEVEPNLSAEQRAAFFADPLGQAAALLGSATTRVVYDLERFMREGQPVCAATLAREVHASDQPQGEEVKVQLDISYSDGAGREIQKKAPAEPGPLVEGGSIVDPRWVGSGWTLFNNKGQPVRQFEPFFDDSHAFRFDERVGVSATLFHDPVGRVVATLHPDHSWEKVVFDAWRQTRWDVNDTALIDDPAADEDVGGFFARLDAADYLPTWYAQRHGGAMGPQEQDAAAKTAAHAATPAVAHADALGRAFLTIGHNRFQHDGNEVEEFQASRVLLDVEGQQRAIVDALDRTIQRTDFGMQGAAIHQASMEAGARWLLNDAGGQLAYGWDSRGQRQRRSYDALRRPLGTFMLGSDGVERQLVHLVYGESADKAEASNLRGRLLRQFDTAGLVVHHAYDFKGNPVITHRQVLADHRSVVDWQANPALDAEVFTHQASYDALNRPVATQMPDGSIVRPRFNRARLLERVDAQLRGRQTLTPFVTGVEYDAKGQRTAITYGNGVRTLCSHDPLTYRLTRCRTLRDTTALQDLSYTYDAAGHVTHITDAAQQTVYFKNQVVTPDSDYTYDALYRLIGAAGREHIGQVSQPQTTWDDAVRTHLPHPNDGQAMRRYTEAYDYDLAGNILSLVHQAANGNWRRDHSYAEASLLEAGQTSNRLSSVTAGGQDGTETFPYDAHGNIVAMSHLPTMAWDPLDRLQSAALPGDGMAYYQYDAAGQRVRKVIERNSGNLVEERITLGGYEIFRRRNAADEVVIEHETLHLMDDRRRIALVETRTIGSEKDLVSPLTRYQHDNHLGSAALELDDSGQVITYEEYYPYGCTAYQAGRSSVEVSLKRYRFTGMERDEETGLNYHGARYYAPWLGRWVSCDPIGVLGGINLYAYGAGDPVNRVDPSGLEDEKSNPWESSEKDNSERHERLMEFTGLLGQHGARKSLITDILSLNGDDKVLTHHGYKPPGTFEKGEAFQARVREAILHYHLAWEANHGRGQAAAGPVSASQDAYEAQKAFISSWLEGLSSVTSSIGGAIGAGVAMQFTDDQKKITAAAKFGESVSNALLAHADAKSSGARRPGNEGEPSGKQKPSAAGAAPPRQIADANLVIKAQQGNQNALTTVRAAETFVTTAQRSEVLNAGTRAQASAREQFLAQEGIRALRPAGKFSLTEAGPQVWDLIDTTMNAGHGPNDAMLAAVSKVTGIPIVTMEKRLVNFFQLSAGKRFNVDIRRVTP